MKKIKIVILIILTIILIPVVALAHSGRTDSNGGHYDYSTGEYHYHHGYEAHQHPDGICPYDYEDKTGQYSFTDTFSDDEQNEEENLANETIKHTYKYEAPENIKKVAQEKVDKKENSSSGYLWIGFVFIILIVIYISYNIGYYNDKKK